MTYQELAAEIIRLPIQERLTVLELVTRSLREDMKPPAMESLAARLRSIARSDGGMLTDDEIKEDYTTYLEQKYS